MHRFISPLGQWALLFFFACGPSTDAESDRPAEVSPPLPSPAEEDQATPYTEDDFTFSFIDGIPGIDPENLAASLEGLFGAENIQADSIYLVDGIVEPGFVVFAGTPNELEVLAPDPSLDRVETMSMIRGRGGAWTSSEGIHLGMNLDELVALNEAPITFAGFAWDYGGFVFDFNRGELQNSSIRLAIDGDPDYGELPAEIFGDVQLRSDDPILNGLNIVVDEMSVINTNSPIKVGTFVVDSHFDRIQAGDTREDLVTYYGEEALEDFQLHIGEGEYEAGTRLFGGTENEFIVNYLNDGRIASVILEREDTPYHEPNVYQLMPGLDLAGLQAINGAPVTFSGFGWDAEGTVVDFNGGELAGYEVVLTPVEEADYELLLGDKLFRSDEIEPELLLKFKVRKVAVSL